MELWIRSQDKEKLIKANKIKYEYYKPFWSDYYIEAIIINDADIIQEYETKARALEVLDEIQELFIKKDIVKSELNKDGLTMVSMPITCIVYEMPNE